MFWGYTHVLPCHERKPRFHVGTVMVELGRLIETPLSDEPPDDRIERDSVSTSNTTITKKRTQHTFALDCTCLNLWPFVYQCFKMVLCQQPCRIILLWKGDTTMKEMLFYVKSSSRAALVCGVLGSIILSECLVLSSVAALAIILLSTSLWWIWNFPK